MLTRILLILTSLLNIVLSVFLIALPSFLHVFTNLDTEIKLGISCPEEEDKCLLLYLVTFVGSLGYSSSNFYSAIYPYWEDIFICITVSLLLMMLSNLALLVYSTTCYFNTKCCVLFICPCWFLISCPVLLLLLFISVYLLVDLNNTTRVTMELQSGNAGMFARTLSILLVLTLYQVLSIMVLVIHLLRDSSSSSPKHPLALNLPEHPTYNSTRAWLITPPPYQCSTPTRRYSLGREVEEENYSCDAEIELESRCPGSFLM